MKFLRSSSKSSLPDDEILIRYKESGDEKYLGMIFERFAHLVFAVAMKYLHNEADAKDSVISVFEHLPELIRKYEIRNFGNWVHSVTKNHCLRMIKERKEFPDDKVIHRIAAETIDQDFEDPISIHIDHLEEAIASLNQQQRQCVDLFYIQEKSYEEIGGITGYTYNEVKSHIQNGKRNLKIYLEKMKKNEPR